MSQGAMPRAANFKQNLCANLEGFSLHAGVRCAANERDSLERLCRYITRPALANERVRCNGAGQAWALQRAAQLGAPARSGSLIWTLRTARTAAVS